MYDLEPNGPPLFLGGWPAAFYGSNLPKYRLAIGVLGKYVSPISVRKFLGPPTDQFKLVRRYFEEVYFRLRNVDGDSILMVWNITSRYQAQLVFPHFHVFWVPFLNPQKRYLGSWMWFAFLPWKTQVFVRFIETLMFERDGCTTPWLHA